MLSARGLRLHHIGRGFLLFHLVRLAFSRPWWHPVVAIAIIAGIAAVVMVQRRGGGGRRW